MQPKRKASRRRERLDAGAVGRGRGTSRDTSAVLMAFAGAILRLGRESDRGTPPSDTQGSPIRLMPSKVLYR